MGRLWDILMWTIVAAMLVLVIMNADNVAKLLAQGGDIWTKETSILTGTSYKKAA